MLIIRLYFKNLEIITCDCILHREHFYQRVKCYCKISYSNNNVDLQFSKDV